MPGFQHGQFNDCTRTIESIEKAQHDAQPQGDGDSRPLTFEDFAEEVMPPETESGDAE